MLKQYIQFVYRFWSLVYDPVVDPIFGFDRSFVIGLLDIGKKDKVLEIGVGTGLNLPYYPKCDLHGIDFSSAMLEKAKQKKIGKLFLNDACNMPFEKEYFDVLLTTYVLRVAPDPFSIMEEAYRVTKKKGRFVILDQFKGNLFVRMLLPFKLILGWGKEYSVQELIEGTSWKIISVNCIGRMMDTQVVVLEKK